MRKTNTGFKAAVCLAVSALLGGAANAQEIIYDNSANSLGRVTGEGNAEIGDAVVFAGTARTVTQVSFEYFVAPPTTPAGGEIVGNETAQFFMYALGNDNIPTTLLYTSPTFNLVPATSRGYGTATISGIAVDAPDRIAWTVAINGIEGNEQGGLLFYNPPTVGSSPTFDPGDGTQHDFFLRRNVSGWAILDTPSTVDNLAVRFTAVPEPGTIALLAGGLVTMGLLRRRKA